MPSLKNGTRRAKARMGMGMLLSLLLITTSILTIITLQRLEAKADTPQTLPEAQVWRQGVSSLLFGANDGSWQWSQQNMGNNPAIAASVKAAGITVIRSPLRANDAQARVSAIEAAGAKCLGILNPVDAQQVVQMMGSRCNMYEWMNEPDNGGPSASAYAQSWNQNIPTLRSINPKAIFIGPVVASPNTGYIQQFLQLAKQAGNIPDVVSYHMYICTDQPISNCASRVSKYTDAATQVNNTVNQVLGYSLPLAVTEWNYSWKPNQTPQNDPFMKTFTALSLDTMAKAGISMATEYDIASNAGGGTLDMVDPQTGQALPQLVAMQQSIQQYQQQAPAPPPVVTTTPGGLQPPGGLHPLQTQTPVPNQPAAVDQPPPVVQMGASQSQAGTFLAGQQLHCVPGAPANPTLNTLDQPANSLLALLGVSQDGCSLVFKIQGAQQQLRLNWWNQGMAVSNRLTFLTSMDSTNGIDGHWQNLPITSDVAAGGSQVLELQNQRWVKVSLMPPQLNTPPINMVMEIYTLTPPTGGNNPISPQPISLPRN